MGMLAQNENNWNGQQAPRFGWPEQAWKREEGREGGTGTGDTDNFRDAEHQAWVTLQSKFKTEEFRGRHCLPSCIDWFSVAMMVSVCDAVVNSVSDI